MDGKFQERKLGGVKAAIFVCGMQVLENMAFMSNVVSLVTYFSGFMNFNLTKSANTLTNYVGTAFLLALLGGFLSDTYLSRFKTCLLFGCVEMVRSYLYTYSNKKLKFNFYSCFFLGYLVLSMQAHFDVLKPTPCGGLAIFDSSKCDAASSGQLAMLYSGLYLVALGSSGIKASLPSLGADQFDERDTKTVSSFFNWFVFSLTFGSVMGLTFVVWVSTNKGWAWAFGICATALFFGVIVVFLGKRFYIINVPNRRGPVVRILQVLVASGKNWKLPVPAPDEKLHELEDKEAAEETEILKRTYQLRFLDRAAIQKSPSDATSDWRLCTVTQVEETKIIIRMLPIILSTIFMNTCLAQLMTFSVQQGLTMDPDLFGFRVPAASLPVIPFLFVIPLVPLYDQVLVPFARKFTGIPTGITYLQRIGVGLVLSIISMSIAGVVETRRKNVAIDHNMVDSMSPLPMTVFWLAFQYAIFGAADMFTLVGLMEFFYAESSVGMKSLGTAISWCSLAFGYYLSSVVVNVVNKVSGGWLASNNLNRDQLNYFYWLLAAVSVLNFGFYLVCSSWYRYKEVEVKKADENDEL
ncbi:protein NRT1/ PTR FAMILY 4.5-like [Aristolochia californica]|uniref:protein NRT1/ PTR FAMILY 4.5-like n=1 Tax=Aristolochia californica TaxID=171875 RepID=UPI0035E2E64A